MAPPARRRAQSSPGILPARPGDSRTRGLSRQRVPGSRRGRDQTMLRSRQRKGPLLPPEHRAPGAEHRPHGDDRVEVDQTARSGSSVRVPRDGLRVAAAPTRRASSPAPPCRWETELFEVVEAHSQLDGSVRYRLEAWPDRHAVRSIQTYDAASETGRPSSRRAASEASLRRRLAILLSPLLGHLPGPVQEHMESEFGAPALAMTIVSALPLFALGAVSAPVFFRRDGGRSILERCPGPAGHRQLDSSSPAFPDRDLSGVRIGHSPRRGLPAGAPDRIGARHSALQRSTGPFAAARGVATLSSRGSPATPRTGALRPIPDDRAVARAAPAGGAGGLRAADSAWRSCAGGR